MSGSSEGSTSVPDSWPALSWAGSLDQGQRVPTGAGGERVHHLVGDADAGVLLEQRPHRRRRQRRQRQLGHVEGAGIRPRLVVAGGEHDDDPFGEQPPGDEQQRVPGGGVEPLEVVDQAQHRFRLAELGQQRQRPQRHQERVEPLPSSSPNATRSARR